jgi:hypothetical protein
MRNEGAKVTGNFTNNAADESGALAQFALALGRLRPLCPLGDDEAL